LAAGNRGFVEKLLALRHDEGATLVAKVERRELIERTFNGEPEATKLTDLYDCLTA
jgi:hypothetical protein